MEVLTEGCGAGFDGNVQVDDAPGAEKDEADAGPENIERAADVGAGDVLGVSGAKRQ